MLLEHGRHCGSDCPGRSVQAFFLLRPGSRSAPPLSYTVTSARPQRRECSSLLRAALVSVRPLAACHFAGDAALRTRFPADFTLCMSCDITVSGS